MKSGFYQKMLRYMLLGSLAGQVLVVIFLWTAINIQPEELFSIIGLDVLLALPTLILMVAYYAFKTKEMDDQFKTNMGGSLPVYELENIKRRIMTYPVRALRIQYTAVIIMVIAGGLIRYIYYDFSLLRTVIVGLSGMLIWFGVAIFSFHYNRLMVAEEVGKINSVIGKGSTFIPNLSLVNLLLSNSYGIISIAAGLIFVLFLGALPEDQAVDILYKILIASPAAIFSIAVIITVAVYALILSIKNPIRELIDAAKNMMLGKLDVRCQVMSGDEVGELGFTFNNLVDNLSGMAKEIIDTVQKLEAVAEVIFNVAEQQTNRAAERAASMNELSSTMEELGQTAEKIAENAEDVAKAAVESLDNAVIGQECVRDTVAEMERIRNSVEVMSKKILALGDKSKQIGEIIETISSIADETHLLALNAAIESAAAGEHGRRFAVVASEVKRLAERSVEATKTIKGILTEIQTAANSSVMATEQSLKEVEKGSALAAKAGQSIDGIIRMIEKSTESTKEISYATEQQKIAHQQVISAMKEMAAASQEAAAANVQIRSTLTKIRELIDRFNVLTEFFKV